MFRLLWPPSGWQIDNKLVSSRYSLRFNLAIFTIYVHNYSLCIYNYKLMYTYTCNIQYYRCKLYKLSPAQQYPCTHITLPTQHTRDLVPPSNPNPPPPYTRRMPKYSCLQVLSSIYQPEDPIRAETCSWYLCNKQHISNHQIVVFDSWLIQL
jgi:hypothetical protein